MPFRALTFRAQVFRAQIFRTLVRLCFQLVQQRSEVCWNRFPGHIGKTDPQRRRNRPADSVPFGNEPFNGMTIERSAIEGLAMES